MEEHTHTDSQTTYDPAATYDACCHPRNLPEGEPLRDTYEAYMRLQRSAAAAADEARLAAITAENAAQEARIAAAAEVTESSDGN